MISPAQLLKKVENKYPELLVATLREEDIFPLTIRANLSLASVEQSQAAKQVQVLASNSKEILGHGYSIEWKQCNSRRFGKNQFPNKIKFETRDDMLQYLGKIEDFRGFHKACSSIISEFPCLSNWLEGNLQRVQKDVIGNVTELLEICRHLKQFPLSGCFVRELPIKVATKFIENNESLLRQWLDLILPASAIQTHEDDFYARFGLRRCSSHFLVRILDDSLSGIIGVNYEEFSLPFEAMCKLKLLDVNVFIVENKTNLLTLPKMYNTIALGGLGNGVLRFQHFPWLFNCKIYYWGDIDIEGFEILSRLRSYFPQTVSVFMDTNTFDVHKQLAVKGNGSCVETSMNLTQDEQVVFECCQSENLRLEQEKISQEYVNTNLDRRL